MAFLPALAFGIDVSNYKQNISNECNYMSVHVNFGARAQASDIVNDVR